MAIQTRSEKTGLGYHKTLQDALFCAREDISIWKISFDIEDGTRVRLVKTSDGWTYENIFTGNRID
jgi:myo-inositol-hexaphosphate 3-phosphohydrolase